MQNGNPRYQLPNTAFVKGAMLKFQCGENENTNVMNGVKKSMRRRSMYRNHPRTPETEDEKQEIMFTAEVSYDDEDEIADQGTIFTQEQVVAKKQFYKSLLDCAARTRRRRVSKILKFLETQAYRNRVTINEMLGLVTRQANYITDRRSSNIANGLELQEGHRKTKLSLAQCSHLILNLKLGRHGYNQLKKVITSQNNHILFQTWKNVRIFQNSRAPRRYMWFTSCIATTFLCDGQGK